MNIFAMQKKTFSSSTRATLLVSPLMHHQAASGEFSAVFFNSFLRKMRSQSLKYMVQSRDGSRKGGVTIHTKIDVQNTAFHSMHFKNYLETAYYMN